MLFFFFQAEDGIRDDLVTGVQTCALPISFGAAVCNAEKRELRSNTNSLESSCLGTSDGRARRDQVTRLMVKTTLSTLSDELWTVALATSVYVPVSRAPCAMLRLNSATPFCRLKVRVGPPHRVPPAVFCPSWIVTGPVKLTVRPRLSCS